MTTAQLKKFLLKEIQKIENKGELELLKETIEFNKETGQPYILNDVQKALIEKSNKEISEGKVKSHEKVMKDAVKWNRRKR